jgi:hypothetical protein
MLLFMHHIALYTPCIALLVVSHTCAFAIDHAEQDPEELQELAQAEDTNPEQEQGKPWCI